MHLYFLKLCSTKSTKEYNLAKGGQHVVDVGIARPSSIEMAGHRGTEIGWPTDYTKSTFPTTNIAAASCPKAVEKYSKGRILLPRALTKIGHP
jgi:hypothetical protein